MFRTEAGPWKIAEHIPARVGDTGAFDESRFTEGKMELEDVSCRIRGSTHSLIVPEKLSNRRSSMSVLFMLVEFGRGPSYDFETSASCPHTQAAHILPDPNSWMIVL